MDDDNLMDVNFSDLDLNQEPTDAPLHRVARYGSLLNELDNTHDRIEDRIRQLEAVTARARQRQRWRQARNNMELSHSRSEMMVDVGERSIPNENTNFGILERNTERGKGCKRDSSHLAKALEMDSEVKEADNKGGSFYDCNICLEMAKDPILTCCGHLFCWPCFYQVSNIDSTSKECPVCKGEVSDSTIIPIYGNGGSEIVCESELGLKIPPRPRAHRVESVRQQRLAQGLSHVPVAEALRRIRISIGAMGHETQEQETGGGDGNFDLGSRESGPRMRIHQVSRVLSESAASLSSLSSALSNAERLVEDLETVINNRLLRNDVGNPIPINQPVNSTADANGSSRFLRMRSSGDVSLPLAPSSSFLRRRSNMSRNLDLDSRDSRESRRRRLN